MTAHEMIGQIASRLCAFNKIRLAQVLGYVEVLSREEAKEVPEKDITQAS